MAAKAIACFEQVPQPNEILVTLVFNACAQLGTRDACQVVKRISSEMPVAFHRHVNVLSSLIDALMHCQDVDSAQQVFESRQIDDLSLVAAMMKGTSSDLDASMTKSALGYIRNGLAQRAIDLFQELSHVNEIVLTLLFNACAQVDTTDDVSNLIKSLSFNMTPSYYKNPRLFRSLLDGLMACGAVNRAETLFDESSINDASLYAVMMKGSLVSSLLRAIITQSNRLHEE
jgi:DNA polymerase III alpha subunit (gram-positive type)